LRDYEVKDALGGALIALCGGIFAYTSTAYRLGTATSMGPGYFPMVVGLITVGLGLWIVGSAFLRSGAVPEVRLRPLFAVVSAIPAFALSIAYLGLVPAIVATVVVSALGDRTAKPFSTLGVAILMAVASWLVFRVGLGLPLPPFRWPT
jgi:hypothetical protein